MYTYYNMILLYNCYIIILLLFVLYSFSYYFSAICLYFHHLLLCVLNHNKDIYCLLNIGMNITIKKYENAFYP